jgi:hypothetical protein
MTDTPQIAAARIDVARRRAERLGTAPDLRARRAPPTRAAGAWA